MIINIDFNSDEAIYIQLRNQIVVGIADASIKEGDSLPSVRQMADELGVNMHTVNKAYNILKQDGYLTLDRRRGAIIAISCDNKDIHVQNINDNMRMLVAEAICKDISLLELQDILQSMYDDFGQ